MDNSSYDLAQLRRRMDSYRAERDRIADIPGGKPSYTGLVYDGGAIPTAVPRVYLTNPSVVTATEAEGSTPTSLATSSPVPVLVLGPAVPIAGDWLLADRIDGLWVAGFGSVSSGSSTVNPWPSCSCTTIPTTLTVTVIGTAPPGSRTYISGTMQYGPTPTDYLGIINTANSFLGTSLLVDPIYGDYVWYIKCFEGFYFLFQVFLDYFGSGNAVAEQVYTWPENTSGNTCIPFMLISGTSSVGDSRTINITA